jgi:transcriptional regulator with XRE-family HTH domain
MATRERPLDRGRRLGRQAAIRLIGELRQERIKADVSQRAMAGQLGWSQARYWRFENATEAVLGEVSAVAAILGLELSSSLHRVNDALADRGQLALLARFRLILSPSIKVFTEALLPNPGDRRSWDMLLRIAAQIVGVEAETKVRDVQATVRKVRGRERDGGADELLIVLADTRANRATREELLAALGERFATPPRLLREALRHGRPLPGSGVLLV